MTEWYLDNSEPVPFGTGCEAVSPEWFLCTREAEHDGFHEAETPERSRITGKFRIVAVWR